MSTFKVIVFGCNHLNMLGLVRSLGEKGIRPYCILLNSADGLVFRSKYPAMCHFASTPQEGYQYIVDHYSNEPVKPILLSSDDVTETIFDRNATALRKHFIVPAADEDGRVTFLMEKYNIANLAVKYGLHVPKMWIIACGDDIPEGMQFPVFTKSLKSIDGGKQENGKCDCKEDLIQSINNSRARALLVQTYIEKETELDFPGVADGKTVFLPFVLKYIRFSENAYGGYVRLERTEQSAFLDNIRQLVIETKYKGMFSVEFILGKDGVTYFTEINFRHDGQSYFTTTGGANLPYLYCKSCVENELTTNCKINKTVVGMNELVDFYQSVSTNKISKFKWIWQCLFADSHLLWNSKDNGPFWYTIKNGYNPFRLIWRKLTKRVQ